MSIFEEIIRRDEDSYFSKRFQENALTANDWEVLWVAVQKRQEIDNKKIRLLHQTD